MGVYSTRFILGVAKPPRQYQVPQGKRAVIKCLSLFNGSTSPQIVTVDVGSLYLWAGTIPAGASSVSPGLMLVINAGELVSVASNSNEVFAHASGYLLDLLPTR